MHCNMLKNQDGVAIVEKLNCISNQLLNSTVEKTLFTINIVHHIINLTVALLDRVQLLLVASFQYRLLSVSNFTKRFTIKHLAKKKNFGFRNKMKLWRSHFMEFVITSQP